MLLYAALYAAFGVASPFLPALVSARGLPAAQLGLVLSAGTAVRLLTAPLAGRLGDVIQGLRVVLVVCLVLAAVWIPGSYAPVLSKNCSSFLRLLKNKGFQEERGTQVGLDAIGSSTPLESNKSQNMKDHRRS
jgi:MFS family permease